MKKTAFKSFLSESKLAPHPGISIFFGIAAFCKLLFLFVVLAFCAHAQTTAPKEWTWMGGNNTSNQPGVYGTLGTPAAGNIPGARSTAVSWTDATGNLWLFGGYGLDSFGNFGPGSLNDLWKFNPSTNEWAWMGGSSLLPCNGCGQPGMYGTLGFPEAGNIPGGRDAAVSWTDKSGHLWLFGGYGYDANATPGVLNDLWEFFPSTNDWAWKGGSRTVPCQQCGDSGTYGTLGTPAAGNQPGGRYDAVSWTDNSGNLWLFGGWGFDARDQLAWLNDLWEFNPSTNEWVWMSGSSGTDAFGVYGTLGTPAAGNVPGSRQNAVSWTDSSGNFWLFGGFGRGTSGTAFLLNDLWEFSPSTNQWAWMSGGTTVGQPGVYGTFGVPAAANVPGARSDAVTWTDSGGDLWLFGGLGLDTTNTGNGGYLNDLWQFNPSTMEWAWMGGSSALPCMYCGQPGVYGVLGSPAAANLPGSREDAVSWSDGKLWLFGGYGFDGSGNSGFLNDVWEFQPPVSGPITPTVLWPAPSPIPYGTPLSANQLDAGAVIPGTTTSIPGTLTYSPAAETVLAAGMHTLSVTFTPSNPYEYSPVTATVQLTVDKALLTVGPPPPQAGKTVFSVAYGDTSPSQYDRYAITGFVNGDTISVVSGSPTVTPEWGTQPNVGTYPFDVGVGTLSATNYGFQAVSGTITVTPGVLTIKPYGGSSKYGSPLAALDYDATGLVYGQTAAGVLSGPPVLSTTATPQSGVGSYPVSANVSGLTAANYTVVAGPNGTLTIEPATLVARAVNVVINQGQPVPALTYRVTGFVNGDTSSVLSGSATLATTATEGSPVGTYPITFSTEGLSAANYDVIYTGATLTVREP